MLHNISDFYNINLIHVREGRIDASPEVCCSLGKQIAAKNALFAHYITDRAGLRIECSWLANDAVFELDIPDPAERGAKYEAAMSRRQARLDRGILGQLSIGEALDSPLGQMAINGYDPVRLGALLMQQGNFFHRTTLALAKFFPGLPSNEIAESTLSEDERYWLQLYQIAQGAEMITDVSRKSLPVQIRQFRAQDMPKFNLPLNHN